MAISSVRSPCLARLPSSVQDSTPILWRGLLLLRTGYVEEAIAALEDAQKMDPLAGINNGYLAIAYLSSAQYAKAEAAARRAFAQGWSPAIPIVIYDLAARGERGRALALWDEFLPPGAPPEAARNLAAVRELLRDPGHAAAYTTLRTAGVAVDDELSIAIGRFDALLDRAERVQKRNKEDRGRHWWLRSAWLPSAKSLRENPRFFAFAQDLGMVRLWEARGYPPGCRRVSGADGTRLDCTGEGR